MQNQLHVVTSSTVKSGGEGLAASRYAESIACSICRVTLLSRQAVSFENNAPSDGEYIVYKYAPIDTNLLVELFSQYLYIHRLFERGQFNLVHLHGVWTPFLAVVALIARVKRIPVIISPHGCLEPWALNFKKLKKRLALLTYQGAVFRAASLFVATADQEVMSIRNLGYRQPIAVIPNGVDVVLPRNLVTQGDCKTILFLSRVHPKKGLLDLVEAWEKVRRPGWKIQIAGGDEGGYRALVEASIHARGVQSDFEFIGFVDGARKQACFDGATIFILPTYSENFGIAVAEAMANELPVITTTGAPWHDLVEHRCGWWVAPGVHGVSSALIDAMACSPEQLKEMGQRGRQLIISKYSWEKIGAASLEVSNWVLNQYIPKPNVINLFENKVNE